MKQYFTQGKLVFCPYALVGYPSMQDFFAIVDVLVESGASILELGVPFSDPSADGPVLTKANAHVVDAGYDIQDIFNAIYSVKKKYPHVGICVMGYYNSFLSYGEIRFAEQAVSHKIDAVLIPDVPVQESINIDPLQRVLIASEYDNEEILGQIRDIATGFVYVLSSVRPTGSDADYREGLTACIQNIRKVMPNKDLVVGFGIKTKDDVAFLSTLDVQGYIVGSEITRRINQGGVEALKNYLTEELL